MMMQSWLRTSRREPATAGFSTWDVQEIEGAESQCTDIIGSAVLDHLMNPDLLTNATRLLPPSKCRAFIESRMPSSRNLRRGVFGEVLAVRYLEDFGGMAVPIKKLRYRMAHHDSPRATDVLAIRVDAETGITEVAYVEAKLRTTRSDISDVALSAHNQLQKDCNEECPAIMGFAAEILSERNDPLFFSLMSYLRSREIDNIDTHHVFIVVDKTCWRDTDLAKLIEHDNILEPLDVYVVVIDALRSKTQQVYKLIGYEEMPDED